jgi:Fibronectin type III domain
LPHNDQDRKNERKDCKVDLMNYLEKTARGLEDLAEENGNNPRIITDSGFELRVITKTEKVSITELDAPTNLVVTNLTKLGYVKLTWDKTENAINYGIRFKPKAETAWQNTIYNDKNTQMLNNLKSDTVYEFEVFAMGPNGLISEPATTVPVYVS